MRLTSQVIHDLYVHQNKSFGEIAILYNCSRMQAYLIAKRYGVRIRTKAQARQLALASGKIHQHNSEVPSQKTVFNERFFDVWSPEMAWVLGLIYTDGNLTLGREYGRKTTRYGCSFSIAQNDTELLEQVKCLMTSNARVRKTRTSCLIEFCNKYAYDRLTAIGLTPRKSLTIKFPDVPSRYLHHFVRGCWDGDGSIYTDRQNGGVRASFASGSENFIVDLSFALQNAGLPPRIIYANPNGRCFQLRFCGDEQCRKLGKFMYKDSTEKTRLRRKWEIFDRIPCGI